MGKGKETEHHTEVMFNKVYVSEEPEHLPRKILTNSLKFYAASSVLEGEESATSDFRDRNDTEFEEVPTIVST